MKYEEYRQCFQGENFPLAYVDVDLLDQNIKQTLKRAGNKKIRIASKSVRCPHILRYILDYDSQFQGLMCYNLSEALFLYQQGFDDLLVAYPCTNKAEIQALCRQAPEANIYLMLDSLEHIHFLQKIGKEEGQKIKVCLDLDLSSVYPFLHFGVLRSSIRSVEDLEKRLAALEKADFLELQGCMGYEAQIAGVANDMPGKTLMNGIIRFLQKRSIPEVAKKRASFLQKIKEKFPTIHLVNGGGTGSLESTREEEGVTEVAAGSAFFAPTLFDGYWQFKPMPAAGFALGISRVPSKGIYTCLGGGYVASGAVGKEKAPSPYLPETAKLTKNEMAGEVQTPVEYLGKVEMGIGDPIFFRHSKAGELCEHFNDLYLTRKGKIEEKVKTYRGFGHCFLG